MIRGFQKFGEMNELTQRMSGNQLRDHVFHRQQELFYQGNKKRAQILSLEELQQYNTEMRKRFREEMGKLPEKGTDLEARTTKRIEMGEFILENIIFKSRPNTYVTGSLYLPKGITYPAPAVLFVGGHSANGRMYDRYNKVCQMLVQVGLIVFAIDPMGQGERRNYFDSRREGHLAGEAVWDHQACGMPGLATGNYLEQYFLRDQECALDYMQTRPEIDSQRIGMTGSSGGGTQTMNMMIWDDRIAAAAPGTFLTSISEYSRITGISQDMEQLWPSCVKYGFDHVNVLMLFAPKPVAVLAAKSDFFPIEGTREAVKEAKRIYGIYGKEENLRLYEGEHGHCYSDWLAVRAGEFFTEIFYGEKRTADPKKLIDIPPEKLCSTNSGNVLGEIEDARPAVDDVRINAKKLRIRRMELPAEVRRNRAKQWLKKCVMQERSPVDFNTRFFVGRLQTEDGYVGERISWWTQKDLFAAGVLIKRDDIRREQALPTVIAIWDDGTRQIESHEEWIRSQCDVGKQVLVLDVPGMGNIKQYNFIEPYAYNGDHGPLYHLGFDLLYMGDSMPAMHCYDVIRTIEMVEDTFGTIREDITLYCDGGDGVYGIMAGFLTDKVLVECGDNLLLSVEREIIEQEPFHYANMMRLIVPGMLEYFDYDELL